MADTNYMFAKDKQAGLNAVLNIVFVRKTEQTQTLHEDDDYDKLATNIPMLHEIIKI